MKLLAFDVETSGVLKEYALQPWRVRQRKAWLTTAAWAVRDGEKLVTGGRIYPAPIDLREMLQRAIDDDMYVVGWNVNFDISWLLAYGLQDLVLKVKWLDGMRLWRHLDIEPENEDGGGPRRGYKLKGPAGAVETFCPYLAGYEEDVDYHSPHINNLKKLLKYNKLDNVATLIVTEQIWEQLTPQQRKCALIEARALIWAAATNLEGMRIDGKALDTLDQELAATATTLEADLAKDGVTRKVIASPTQLSKLIYDQWGLPILKPGKISAKTGKMGNPSTDKESLHELSFIDPRAKKLRAFRESLDLRNKFVKSLQQSVAYNGDSRTHPEAYIFGTYCVPGTTEVLTRRGWVPLHAWSGGEIAQVRPDLTIEFLPAQRFIGPEVSQWVEITPLKCLFTHGHTIPYLAQKTAKWRTTQAGLLAGESKSVPVAGTMRLDGRFTAAQMRLFAAVQADGYECPKEIKFTFVKLRKLARVQELLRACGVTYRLYTCAAYPRRTEVHIAKSNVPAWLRGRKVLGPWVLDTTETGLKAFVDELVHWDGCPHPDGGFQYSSAIELNVSWVCTAAALVGYKASEHKRQKALFACHVSHARAVRAVRPQSHVRTVETPPQQTYCATTQTGFWLARSNGRIFVTGNTSRFTYSSKQGKGKDEKRTGFALAQMKRGPKFRGLVLAKSDDEVLLEFDAAGQEYRWMAIKSGDPAMLAMCQPGEDPHSFMASNIDGRDYRQLIADVKAAIKEAEDFRQLGKVGNLSLQYRTSAKKLRVVARVQYDIPMEADEAINIHRTYPRVYKLVPPYWRSAIAVAKQLGYAETLAGRRVKIVGDWSSRSTGWSMESTAINYPIQGTGGDQKYLAIAVLSDYMIKHNIRFAWDLHDGLYFYCPRHKAEKASFEMKYLLDNLPYKRAWGFTPPIPLPWDAKMGESWGGLKKVA